MQKWCDAKKQNNEVGYYYEKKQRRCEKLTNTNSKSPTLQFNLQDMQKRPKTVKLNFISTQHSTTIPVLCAYTTIVLPVLPFKAKGNNTQQLLEFLSTFRDHNPLSLPMLKINVRITNNIEYFTDG